MLDRATHWFYAEQQLSAGATVEKMRQDFWMNGFYNVWFTLTKKDSPYILRGMYAQQPFEVELERQKYLVVRASKENEWLRLGFTRTLQMPPHFQYTDTKGNVVWEWRMAGRDARWQAMQGVPAFKNLKRLYEVIEYV
jgi:hypothetical protein